ncbi:ankyrin repeat domain-containing protein 40 isoform X2 [Agrilus planipennis]|uniref:Ankyrin repeat domain-containing protein 40 isoform X2 n=1 Tax=Agrilus planipennis TaxID=224129 RepID=A0A1W4XBC7_AGRPL|nr:ankyrin repeat domain-containing protein 40 isoform X2 [Agrilus planipennis]
MANVFEENLREASCVGDIEAVESLLKHNVDINSKNAVNGWTALHWACKRGNEDVVKILMNNGADPKVETFKGETAAHLCSNSSILALLEIPPSIHRLILEIEQEAVTALSVICLPQCCRQFRQMI